MHTETPNFHEQLDKISVGALVTQLSLFGYLPYACLEGHGHLVSRLIMGMTGVTIWLPGVLKLPTKSP